MASSSSATDSCDNHDVFLSFRGEDTRYNFTSHLYDALCRNNIKAFIDYRIDRGDEITPALERVIEGAKISIVVFSKNYAESTFCLDELVRIMECKESKTQIVLPIFYKVDPSEVTYQKAFATHETNTKGKKRRRGETIKQGMKKVERWKSAFLEAVELAGWHILKNSDEAEIIGKITKEVSKKLNNSLPKGEELMCTSLVGQTAEDNFNKIWECLMNDKISRVGAYGMGGVGKTTIAAHINNQLLASVNSFSCVCWATVSKDLSIRNMQINIAKMINLDLSKEDDERKRAAKLRKRLETEKFVLILDDVWEAFEIEEMGIPPLVGGRKLLLTSRSRRVCEIMECQPFEVKPLSKQEALDLFVKESKYQINDSLEWREIVHSIVEECDGLPLAIVVIARRMRGVKEIRNWRNNLKELRKPCEGENREMEKKVYKVLKFSYDCLPNDKYRQCFLYCSLFSEDFEFEKHKLINYWIAEGLIGELDSRQEELDRGYAILEELICSSLLEDIGKSSNLIKMHDVIRDMARINAKVGLQFQDPLESVQALYGDTKLKSFPFSAPLCSKLRTLLLGQYYTKGLPGCFFANMESLTILDIENARIIPDSLTNLRNLRMLIIYRCSNLKCISLGGLEKLRYLEIIDTDMEDIPQDMERLVNLRVLDLSLNISLRGSFPCGVLEKLSHLQTLKLLDSGVEVELEALISLEKLETLIIHFYDLHKLDSYMKSEHWRRLVDYQIYCGNRCGVGNWKKVMSLRGIEDVEEWKGKFCIFLPDDIQSLKLENWESPRFNVLRNKTFADLQRIHIWEHRSWFLFTVDLAQQLLRNVKELMIKYSDELEEIIPTEAEWIDQSNYINYPTIVFPKLKILLLTNLQELRGIYRGRMVCPSLELIQIKECDKLDRLPFCMKKEGNQQNPIIQLQGVPYHLGYELHPAPVSRRWWNSLQWDNLNDKSMYHLQLQD